MDILNQFGKVRDDRNILSEGIKLSLTPCCLTVGMMLVVCA